MSDNPYEIRANIEATRQTLGGNVDALADKVDPQKVVDRQTEKVKSAIGGVKDRLFGAASDTQDTAGSAADSIAGAGQKVASKAQGNPLAVGLIAFGAGLLVSSLIPASSKEKELAADALLAAHLRGVTVRVLYDHISTIRSPKGRATRRWLREAGVEFHEMLPFYPFRTKWRRPDLRNHRKVLVVDGMVGFMGSQNMVDASYNKRGNIKRHLQWKDLMVRLEGPVVAGVDAIFITDWYSETDELLTREADPIHVLKSDDTLDCQIVPSGPGFEGENNLRTFNALLHSAQERLVIVSPYFVPDDSMLYAITTAAERGVKVQLFACEIADQAVVYHAQRSYYETLLRAGVRIYLYEKPVVLHAKHFTIDDEVAVIGSSNMDMRSLSLNFEVSLLVRGKRFVDSLRRVEENYCSHSRELHLEEWLQRRVRSQVLDNLSRLTASVQ